MNSICQTSEYVYNESMDNNMNITIKKTVIYNGIEIRRSNEITSGNAYLHRNPFTWVVDGHASKHSFGTQKEAQRFIDETIKAETNNAYGDWSGNYFIVRPVNGKFTEVAINKDEYKSIKSFK